jgi:hypothetical protein
VGKSNENIDKKKSSIRMGSKQYYHDCKFNWKTQKQQCSYKNNQQWIDYSSNMPTSKTNDISELQNDLHHALKGLDMALQLHFINPFQKWKLKTFIYKQKNLAQNTSNDHDKANRNGSKKGDCRLW